MEREDDVHLIRSILSGDDTAFSVLVRKHQKSIHALAWRKVGDFHAAEEITQDTFFQAYKNLAKLRNPNQFAGWAYVIANRLCLRWLKKNKSTIQSLEGTPMAEIEKSSYTRYVSEQREIEVREHRYERVKKLLAQLPESERTVVTLHYLGEMTAKEIGKFLGVSVNTIKSRLRRGIKRLRDQGEEFLVRETLGGIPFPAHVTERIMRQVADISPTAPPVGKPLVPWVAFGTTVVLVLLMLGASNQILARFQKPYSFEAASERTIEILDAPIVLDVAAKPAVRNQFGQAATPGKNSGSSPQVSDVTLQRLLHQTTMPHFLPRSGHREKDRQRVISVTSSLHLKELCMLLHQQEFTDYQQMRPHGYTSTRVSLLVNLEYRWQRMTECFILFLLMRYSLQMITAKRGGRWVPDQLEMLSDSSSQRRHTCVMRKQIGRCILRLKMKGFSDL